jgi:hypothetical protein
MLPLALILVPAWILVLPIILVPARELVGAQSLARACVLPPAYMLPPALILVPAWILVLPMTLVLVCKLTLAYIPLINLWQARGAQHQCQRLGRGAAYLCEPSHRRSATFYPATFQPQTPYQMTCRPGPR